MSPVERAHWHAQLVSLVPLMSGLAIVTVIVAVICAVVLRRFFFVVLAALAAFALYQITLL